MPFAGDGCLSSGAGWTSLGVGTLLTGGVLDADLPHLLFASGAALGPATPLGGRDCCGAGPLGGDRAPADLDGSGWADRGPLGG